MLNKITMSLMLSFAFSFNAIAGTTCWGEVKSVMERKGECDGNISFIIDGVWLCSIGPSSSSIVLAAYSTGNHVEVVFDNAISNEATCNALTTHFLTPWSIRTIN